MISYFERYLILAVLCSVQGVVSAWMVWPHSFGISLLILAGLCSLWAIGRIYSIHKIRATTPRSLSIEQIRAELERSHSWWTVAQLDDLLSRYARFQKGDFQDFLLDNVRLIEPDAETPTDSQEQE